MNINKNFFAVILIVIAAIFTVPAKAQVSIGDQTNPQPFSLLELITTKVKAGLRLPHVTTAQRDSIALTSTFVSNPLSGGLVIYNTDTNCLEFWNLAQWVSLCAEAAAGTIGSLDCASVAAINVTQGTAANATATLPYSGKTGADIALTDGQLLGGPVSGLSVVVNGAQTLTAASGNINIKVTGTATTSGTIYIPVTLAGASCSGNGIAVTSCAAPAAPGTMTLSPAAPIVIDLNGTFTATVPNVAGMTYTWTLPTGLTGTSTTNSITITGATAGSYDASAITVTATNSCGATSAATAGSGTGNICVGAALRNDIPASIALGGYTWSTKNVDAPGTFTAHAGDPGMFYQWDSKTGWSSSDPMTSNPAGQTWNTTASSKTVWDMTNNNPCPTGWTVPTDVALTALNNLGNVWIDACTVAKLGLGTLPGRIFGTTTIPATYADFNPTTMLFLPAAGYRNFTNGALYPVGTGGYYWSSVQSNAASAYYLFFLSSSATVLSGNKAYGCSVRCVTP